MKSKNSKISPKNAKIYTQTLREKAELISHDDVSFLDNDYSPEKMRDLLQELQVHQIELELQNEELRSTQTALETERMRYVDFYDLAPVGYCTLNEENVILQANLRTASLLGVTRKHLLGLPLTRFIQNEDQDIHYLCRRKEQGSSEMQSCTLRMVRDDRTVFWAQFVMMPYKNDQYNIVLYDVTEDKKQKEIIARSQREWTDAFDGIEDAIMLHDKEYNLMRVNKAYKELSGAEKFKDIIGKPYYQVFPKLDAPMHSCVESLRSGKCEEENFDLEDGRIFKSRTYPVYDDAGEYNFSIHIFENISEWKKTQGELKLFRTLIDHSSDSIEVLEPLTMHFLDVNDTACQNLGYSREEMLSMSVYDINPQLDTNLAEAMHQQLLQTGNISIESIQQRKDGSTFPVEAKATLIELDKPYIFSIVRDITERKKTEQALQASEARYRLMFESSRDALVILSLSLRKFIGANKAAVQLFRAADEEEFIATISVLNIMPEQQTNGRFSVDFAEEMIGITMRDGSNFFECVQKSTDGKFFYTDVLLTLMEVEGEEPFIQGTVRDITERKQAEKSLLHANRAFKTLLAANMALVQARSEGELLQRVVDIIVKEGGYSLAVVDYAEDNQEKTIIPMAWSGLEGERYWIDGFSWSDTAANQMPLSKVIRTATMQFTHNIAAETEFALWRNAALARGYTVSITLPLMEGDKVFGALNIYSSEVNRFKDKEEEDVRLLNELANNLAYGIVTLRARVAHEQQAVLLRESLEQSIQTIAATVEARDPYTAGHQKHVGELATAIAEEMDLSEKQVHGIHLAAIIHDLGKIHIPAEILAKPGKLSSIEFMMIQTHPQEGYNILKDVKFPWPIADIILQHHEKLDGSGYPQGLKGDQILLEAKIITVADVVEAMSSHRPYRASLGIEAALNEIKRGRGTIYEASVVDACLKLFTEKGFVFSSESF